MLLELSDEVSFIVLSEFLTIKDCYMLSLTCKIFQPLFGDMIQVRIDRSLRSKLETYLGDKIHLFIDAMRKSGAVLSGSFVLQALLEENWKSSDIDIFIGKDETQCEFSLIEKFLYSYCVATPTSYEQERLAAHYSHGVIDFDRVINYNFAPSVDNPFHAYSKPIYDAILEEDVDQIRFILTSMPTLSDWGRKCVEDILRRDDEDVLEEALSLTYSLYQRPDLPIYNTEDGKMFQVIRKNCTKESVIENIYGTFDFDFCKAVSFVNENGRFTTHVCDWGAILNRKCSFPSPDYYCCRALWITIMRYFKYRQRGFDIETQHSRVLRDLMLGWASEGLNHRSLNLDFSEVDKLSSISTLEEIRTGYLKFLRTCKEKVLHPYYSYCSIMIKTIK